MNSGTKRSKLSTLPLTSISFLESSMSEARDCVVKLVDDHGCRAQCQSPGGICLRSGDERIAEARTNWLGK
jgi:hypothetical protein